MVGHSLGLATRGHNRRNVTHDGHGLYQQLMDELTRVAIAQRIKQARNEAGLHQHEVADLLQVHKNTVSNWESQSKPVTPWDRLTELSGVLGVSREWLIHGDPEPTEDSEPLLRAQVVDALQALQESQESVHARLDEATSALLKLEDSLSRLLDRETDRGKDEQGRTAVRPQ